MKTSTTILLMIIVAAGFGGCYYDKKDVQTPSTQVTCDTANMTYNGSIESIIQANCYSCHSGSASGANGITLDNYSDLKSEADFGELMRRITSNDPSYMMPKGGPKLSDCNISKIGAWVNRGSPQ